MEEEGVGFDGSQASLYARANAAYCTELAGLENQPPDPGFFAECEVKRG